MKKTMCFLFVLLYLATAVFAQDADRKIAYPEQYWGDIDVYLDKQHEALLGQVETVLEKHPPELPEHPARKSALFLIDGVLHEEKAPERPSVQDFYHRRMNKVLDELESTRVTDGAIIWKLYDHGFIVRTSSVTFAFDMIRGHSAGAEGFAVDDPVMERIAGQCDALFISHIHGDHADEAVAGMFLANGKLVVAPDNLWQDKPLYGSITHLKRIAYEKQRLDFGNWNVVPVFVYPGHQGDLVNNVYVVTTPEGLTFCQTGDQANDADFAWIDEVKKHQAVDVLMPNCWTTDMVRMAEGFNPSVVITGHENELGHTIDHREPFWLTYRRFPTDKYPLMPMAWGESFRYRP